MFEWDVVDCETDGAEDGDVGFEGEMLCVIAEDWGAVLVETWGDVDDGIGAGLGTDGDVPTGLFGTLGCKVLDSDD